ncbi:Bromodomain-containing protein, partial [Vararia minispora EC-137]
FMDLPDRKQWAIYYKTIQKPMCFDKVYKHLQRKEYKDVAAFAADVELIFDNAMAFNEDHTFIWESARMLR